MILKACNFICRLIAWSLKRFVLTNKKKNIPSSTSLALFRPLDVAVTEVDVRFSTVKDKGKC